MDSLMAHKQVTDLSLYGASHTTIVPHYVQSERIY